MEDTTIKRPKTVAFEIASQCRYACQYCEAGATHTHELNTEHCKKILQGLSHYAKCTVIFAGGEPLERPDIYDIIAHSQELGLQSVVATCGYLVEKGVAQRLKDLDVLFLSLSLDGSSAETHDLIRRAPGAFDAAVNATHVVNEVGLPFQINCTLSRINKHEVIAIARLAERLGAASFNPLILIPTAKNNAIKDQLLNAVEYETLLNELLKIKFSSKIPMTVTCGPQFARVTRTRAEERLNAATGCMGGREYGYITRQGDVQTCGSLQVQAGNLLQNGYDFRKIWEESHLLKEIRDRDHYQGKCRLCDHLDACGGCRARAFIATGNYLGDDPLCP